MALRPESGPLLIAIGAIVIWWGRIEGIIFQETMNLGLHPDVANAGICEPLQIATERLIAQWAKASRLVTADNPELQAEISKVKGELSDCASDRHILVHGFWDYPHDGQVPLQSKITVIKPARIGGVTFEQFEVNYQTLTELHDRLSRLYHRILGVTGDVAHRVLLARRPRVQQDETEATEAADQPLPPDPSQTAN